MKEMELTIRALCILAQRRTQPIMSWLAPARFRLKCEGVVVAGCDGPLYQAWNGIMHYARQYAEEGPIRLEMHNGRRWTTFQRALPHRRNGAKP